MKENSAFISFENKKAGLVFDDSNHNKYPIKYYNIINGEGVETKSNCSYYGFVYFGSAYLIQNDNTPMFVENGMYFSLPESFKMCGNFKMILIEVFNKKGIYPKTNFSAMKVCGGKIEYKGRLKYIDGCTDSLLIPPVKLGNPCLNHLHFPKGIDQTQHTHPSHRIGIVANGNGFCKTPFGDLPLNNGDIFVIKEWNGVDYAIGKDGKNHPIGTHSFQTFRNSMDVIAFHPDSDFGATDINHPMINKTIVDGISANKIEKIRTK